MRIITAWEITTRRKLKQIHNSESITNSHAHPKLTYRMLNRKHRIITKLETSCKGTGTQEQFVETSKVGSKKNHNCYNHNGALSYANSPKKKDRNHSHETRPMQADHSTHHLPFLHISLTSRQLTTPLFTTLITTLLCSIYKHLYCPYSPVSSSVSVLAVLESLARCCNSRSACEEPVVELLTESFLPALIQHNQMKQRSKRRKPITQPTATPAAAPGDNTSEVVVEVLLLITNSGGGLGSSSTRNRTRWSCSCRTIYTSRRR